MTDTTQLEDIVVTGQRRNDTQSPFPKDMGVPQGPVDPGDATIDPIDQTLEEQQCSIPKNRKIWELERRVELLEQMLNRASAQQGGFPQPQPLPSIRRAPRRWAVR